MFNFLLAEAAVLEGLLGKLTIPHPTIPPSFFASILRSPSDFPGGNQSPKINHREVAKRLHLFRIASQNAE